MTTFVDAVEAVYALRVADWGVTVGEPYVSSDGREDAEGYLVVWGAREYLLDGNLDYALVNGTVTFVSRATGAIRDELMILNFDKVDAMTRVSA